VNGFEAYKTYLGLKLHFSEPSYDFSKYNGKVKASVASFNNRKDRLFFERLSTQKKDNEIIDFFVSNFTSLDDPSKLWIGDIIRDGNKNYIEWQKRIQSLSYIFEQELKNVFEGKNFLDLIEIKGNRHPQIFKEYLMKNLSLETLVILDKILKITEKFDPVLLDPVWELNSNKIKKYSSLLKIESQKYKDIIRKVLL
jgi:hypothetical protein